MTDIVEAPITAIAEYSQTEAALADLRSRYQDVVFDVATTKGMAVAIESRRELRDLRVGLEKMRVELKAPVLERGRLLDAEAKRITAELVRLEEPIDFAITREQQRKEDARRERVRIEEERITTIKRRIDAIRQLPLAALGKTVGGIQADIVIAMDIDTDLFDPAYREEAEIAVDETVAKLTQMRDQRREQDKEARRLEEERAEVARLRKAEDQRIAAENAARAEAQRQEDEARAARQREEDETAAARRRDEDAARAEVERAAQAERDRVAAEERAENARQAEANRVEAVRLAAEREQEHERRRQREQEEAEAAIANATLVSAAQDVLVWLDDRMYGYELVALKLKAALSREATQ